MTELGILKKRMAALSAAISEFESSFNGQDEQTVDLKQELNKLNLEDLKDVSAYITELMVRKASGKKTEKMGKRMPLVVKQNMVNKYMESGEPADDVKEEYLVIEQKRPKDRNEDERKKFMDFRNKAQKWFEANFPKDNE